MTVVTQIRAQVWLPVDSDTGDAVDAGLVVERADTDEISLTFSPNYEAEKVNVWMDRAAASALIAEVARALAEAE